MRSAIVSVLRRLEAYDNKSNYDMFWTVGSIWPVNSIGNTFVLLVPNKTMCIQNFDMYPSMFFCMDMHSSLLDFLSSDLYMLAMEVHQQRIGIHKSFEN